MSSAERSTQRTASLLAQLRRPAAPRGAADQPPPFLNEAAASALAITPPELRLAKIKAAKLTGPQELTIVT
eukprot:COSAG03_NODE_26356_length_259_cov_1.556250_1_plen_70_part_10